MQVSYLSAFLILSNCIYMIVSKAYPYLLRPRHNKEDETPRPAVDPRLLETDPAGELAALLRLRFRQGQNRPGGCLNRSKMLSP